MRARCNLQATHHLANLAAGFSHLRAFVHLSSAYANCDRPRGSHVEERLYPMDWGRSSSTGEKHTLQSLAAELRSLPADEASRQVRCVMVRRTQRCLFVARMLQVMAAACLTLVSALTMVSPKKADGCRWSSTCSEWACPTRTSSPSAWQKPS